MRTRCVPAVVVLGFAALMGGCSGSQFVYAPLSEPPHPILQSSGDDAGMKAFAQRAVNDADDTAQATASETVNMSMNH